MTKDNFSDKVNSMNEYMGKYGSFLEAGNKPSIDKFFHPTVYDAIYKYWKTDGKIHVFLMSEEYHGLYHDDYATFLYWDDVTGKVIKDDWTTASYCPSYSMYKLVPSFDDAYELGLIDKDKYLAYRKSCVIKPSKFDFVHLINNYVWETYIGMPVVVNRGRKFKGFGYFVGIKQYKGYTGDVVVAEVYDNLNDEVREVNPNYIDIHEEIITKYNNWADNVLKNMSADDCLNMINISFADFVKKNSFNKPNTDNAYYVEKSERIMKLHEKRQMMIEKKMPGIRNWVKENTDKTGVDAEQLAIHIFRKNNEWLYN